MQVIKGVIALIIAIAIATLIFRFENKAIKSINNNVSNSATGQTQSTSQ